MLDRERVGAGLRIDEQRRGIAVVHVRRAAEPAAPTSTRPMSWTRTTRPGPPDLTMMSANWSVWSAGRALDIDLVGLVARGWRLVQDAGRDLQVLRAESREHLAGIDVVGRSLVRIEPNAHGNSRAPWIGTSPTPRRRASASLMCRVA